MKVFITAAALAACAYARRTSEQIPIDDASTEKPLAIEGIPLLGFGTWNLDKSNASEAVSWAIQEGYRHIDCAAAYGNEHDVGRGIADGLQKTGLTREDLWITSKLWNDHHDPNLVGPAIDATIRHLGVGYLDLYHMHFPVAKTTFGSHIEYRDTYAAMVLELQKGKTRHLGVSNFSPYQLEDLLNHTSHPPAVHQMEMHPYLQQNEYLAMHKKLGIHVTAYSPFAGTNPTYKPKDLAPLLQNKVVTKIAKKRGCTPAQVALIWGMSRGTSVIPKSQRKDRITENLHSVECVLEKKDFKAMHKLGKARVRFANAGPNWGVDLYEGLEDSKGNHKAHS